MSERPQLSDNQVEQDAAPGLVLHVLPPLAAFVEMIALLAVPALLDAYWPVFPTLSEFQPHFFWLPVLLISLQYGTISGLLAAGLAIALSAALGWPDQEIGENHFSYLLRVWTQPVLWLTAALILGQFRMRQIELKRDLAMQVTELVSQRNALADYSTNLRSRCDDLEREIVRRRDPSARSMMNALGNLESGDPRRQLQECTSLAFGTCRLALFSRDADGLRMVYRHGDDLGGKAGRDRIGDRDPLFTAIVHDRASLSVLSPMDEFVLAGEGMAAVPIFNGPSSDEVIGMLILELTDPTELDQATTDRLAVLARHIAPLLLPADRTSTRSTSISSVANATPTGATVRPRIWRQLKRANLNPTDARNTTAKFG